MGIGNTPPPLFYGPWAFNLDFSLAKDFRLGESKTLEFRVETFHTLNHFNPSNPSASLTDNFTNGAQTNSNFGVISSAQMQARRSVMSVWLKF